jgi:hypothetical protein
VRIIQVIDRDPARQRLYYNPAVGALPEPYRHFVEEEPDARIQKGVAPPFFI